MASVPTPPRIVSRIPPPPRDDSGPRGANDVLVAGDLLEGRYQIEAQIGEGGVGVVYRALQLKLHRRVAVKVLLREQIGDQLLRPRFEREAITLAALSHPNIVSLTDYGLLRGRPFIVMELLEGKTLRELLDTEGPFEVGRALALVRQILYALGYAHGKGIVHRDLKPANIIVEALPNQPEHLKILDFGLAKLLPGSLLDSGEKLSRAGYAFGTPAYMSPEHAMLGELDARSDLYSLGVLLFELLTGQKPYSGPNEEIIRGHLTLPFPRLVEAHAQLSGLPQLAALQSFLDRAVAKTSAERFASAHEMREALESLLDSARPTALARPNGHPFGQTLQRVRESLAPVERRASDFFVHQLRPRLRQVEPLARRSYEFVLTTSKNAYARAEPACRAFYARARPVVVSAARRALERARHVAEQARARVRALADRNPRFGTPSLPAPSEAVRTTTDTAVGEPPATPPDA